MKKLTKILGLFFISFFAITLFVSCDRDDDPVDNDFFAGTYSGDISYNADETSISTSSGKVFVTKIASGTKYNFAFSDSIPDLNGVEFEKKGDNVLVSVGATDFQYIRIDNNTLKILYTVEGKTWTANCTR